ncbi:MAG: hypothetical protein KDC05_11920 [Bacteroidales bacterium]|nr:hypothetical protein [Bacteroidales bacterium]
MKTTMLSLLTILLFCNIQAQPTWTQLQETPDCRYEGVVFTAENMVYYGLGIKCLGPETTEFYEYDPATDSWSPIANFPGQTRRLASAFSINGKGYVCLGFSNGVSLQDLWEYDPSSDSWSQKSNFPGGARGAAVASVVNGKAYVGTGFGPGGASLYPMDFWEYDPQTDTWIELETMPGVALYTAQSFAVGDSVYVIGGVGGNLLLPLNEVWAYSVSGNSWTQKPDFPGGQARFYPTAFSIGNRGYFGYGMLGPSSYLGDFWTYDPSTGNWQTMISSGWAMLFNGGGGGVATTTDGYCVGGRTSNNTTPATMAMWQFTPDMQTDVDENIQSLKDEMLIYPNPASGKVTLQGSQPGFYILTNNLGQVMERIFVEETTVIDLDRYEPGTCFIRSESEPAEVSKLIISK